jgi:hypothetical protein
MTAGSEIQRTKARGWVTIIAGIFIVVLMSGVWLFVMKAISEHRGTLDTPNTAKFLGQTYMAFGLIVFSGVLGIANGVVQLRTGRRNIALNAVILMLVAAAVVIIWLATSNKS